MSSIVIAERRTDDLIAEQVLGPMAASSSCLTNLPASDRFLQLEMEWR